MTVGTVSLAPPHPLLLFYFPPTTAYPKLETGCTLWSPALTFSFPLRDHIFHLCSAFGKTERFSGALRQQLGGHMCLRSRHEGLRVPSDSTAAAPPRPRLSIATHKPHPHRQPRRGANEGKQAGFGQQQWPPVTAH